MPGDKSFLDIIDDYLKSNLVLIPLGFGDLDKVAAVAWKERELSDKEIREYFSKPTPNNVGLKLVTQDNKYKLVDVDIDMQNVGVYAHYLLPPTQAIIGRKGKPFSHFIYDISDNTEVNSEVQFRDPYPIGSVDVTESKKRGKVAKVDGHDPTIILEVRAGMHYTMIPPSVHKNGEDIVWHTVDGKKSDFVYPAKVDYNDLLFRSRLLAGAIFLSNHWPESGSRHNAALFVAGGLISAGVSLDLVNIFISIVCDRAGDTKEIVKDRLKAIESSYKRFLEGDTIAGWGALTEIIASTLVNHLRGILYLPTGNVGNADDRYTDRGNARRMLRLFPNTFRYAPEIKRFYIWSGTHWKPDIQNEIELFYKKMVENMFAESTLLKSMEHRKKLQDHATRSESNGKIKAVISTLQTEPEVNVLLEGFNTRGEYFNFTNGTVDLRSGELVNHSPDHLITQICPYNYNPFAECPKFLDFLLYIMGGNQNLVDYLQMLLGYAMVGKADLKAVHFLYGPTTDNGKTTLTNIVKTVLGPDYCGVIPYEVLMEKKSQNNEMMWLMVDFRYKRLAIVSEPAKNTRLNESRIKSLSGRNTQKVRSMYTGYDTTSEFVQKFKLIIETNDLPIINSNSEATWNRVRIIPFDIQIPKERQISAFEDIIVDEEAEGVLAWMVRGAMKYYEINNIPVIPEVVIATQSHRVSMDSLQEFIDECIEFTEPKPVTRVLFTQVRQAYFDWMAKGGNSSEMLSKKEFEIEMMKKGYDTKLFAGNRYYYDMKLISKMSIAIDAFGAVSA